MSTVESKVETAVAATPVKKSAKKSVKKVAKKASKKSSKKAAKKVAKKAAPVREKKSGLRKPQVRILQCLAKSRKPLSRKEISEKAPCDVAYLVEWIGAHDEQVRAKNDKKVMMSLLSLKAVKFAALEDGSAATYEITSTGTKMLAAATSK